MAAEAKRETAPKKGRLGMNLARRGTAELIPQARDIEDAAAAPASSAARSPAKAAAPLKDVEQLGDLLLKDGAVSLRSGAPRLRTAFTVNPDLLKQLKRLCHDKRMTMTDLVQAALVRELQRHVRERGSFYQALSDEGDNGPLLQQGRPMKVR